MLNSNASWCNASEISTDLRDLRSGLPQRHQGWLWMPRGSLSRAKLVLGVLWVADAALCNGQYRTQTVDRCVRRQRDQMKIVVRKFAFYDHTTATGHCHGVLRSSWRPACEDWDDRCRKRRLINRLQPGVEWHHRPSVLVDGGGTGLQDSRAIRRLSKELVMSVSISGRQ